MNHPSQPSRFLCAVLAAALLLSAGAPALRADAPGSSQRTFDSPQDALKALVEATKSGDRAAIDAIFGPDAKDLMSGDAKQDAIEMASFAKAIGTYSSLARQSDDRYVVDVGDQNWPMPIPLVKGGGGWFFDTAAGKEEVLNRRIGEDELTAIGVCHTYVDAQREYASEDRDGSGVLKYAQRIRSTHGAKDGLYWPAAADEDQSPLGPLISEARAEGYTTKTAEGAPQPFHGYLFKILTAQGASAPGGAFSYIINGNMIAGFALVAYPAHWGESGVMTFIVNQWGKVYQRNLGADSADVASQMTEFDPDDGWTAVSSP